MSALALGIVLASAFLHAGWNCLLKLSGRKTVFIWWFLLAAVVLYLPVFLLTFDPAAISPAGWACVAATGLLHGLYFGCIGGAYQRGDLSLVYPLARGSGPLFVPLLAAPLLGEEVSPLGMAGIVLIVAGIYCIHLRALSRAALTAPFAALRGGASLWSFGTGLAIAGYSLVDKVGVGLVAPPVYIYLMILIAWLLITPGVLLRERPWLMGEWRRSPGAIVLVGFLSIFTYLMILYALTLDKVSYVAAVREISIVLTALFGILWLGESHGRQKLLGAFLMTLGVAAIGLSR